MPPCLLTSFATDTQADRRKTGRDVTAASFFPNLPVLADFVLATAVVAYYDIATRLAELQVS